MVWDGGIKGRVLMERARLQAVPGRGFDGYQGVFPAIRRREEEEYELEE